MSTKLLVSAVATSALLLGGCATQPETYAELEEAKLLVAEVDSDPMAAKIAGAELTKARQALTTAENADKPDVIRQEAYVAATHAKIASERIAEARARQQIEEAEAQRNAMLLSSREREADRAQMKAEIAETKAEINAQKAEMEAERARLAEERADNAMDQARMLADKLQDMKAEQTARGLVLTLSDVLFDTDQAELKPGAQSAMDRITAFMNDYPEYRLLIEGHTDGQGSDAYNESLSARRAAAVANALMARGISSDRIATVGLGEAYPVASNDTPAGRQQNRRVEIVLSDQNGDFPQSANRTASMN